MRQFRMGSKWGEAKAKAEEGELNVKRYVLKVKRRNAEEEEEELPSVLSIPP